MPEMLLYFAARAQNLEELILPALDRGAIVLADRYTDSTLAYQGAGRGLGEGMVLEMHQVACRGIWPEITLYLDIDPELGLARRHATDEVNRLDVEALDFHRRVRRDLPAALRRPSLQRVKVIDGSGSISMCVAETVWSAVSGALFAVTRATGGLSIHLIGQNSTRSIRVKRRVFAAALILPLFAFADDDGRREVKIQKTSLTKEQEIELGRQAAAQVEQQMEIVNNHRGGGVAEPHRAEAGANAGGERLSVLLQAGERRCRSTRLLCPGGPDVRQHGPDQGGRQRSAGGRRARARDVARGAAARRRAAGTREHVADGPRRRRRGRGHGRRRHGRAWFNRASTSEADSGWDRSSASTRAMRSGTPT